MLDLFLAEQTSACIGRTLTCSGEAQSVSWWYIGHTANRSLHSTSKAKKHGFFGFVDSYEGIFLVIDEFVQMKIIPDPKAISPKS